MFPSILKAVASMESDSYKLRWPNLNMTSGSKSSANYNINDTVGQTAAGEYDSAGFKVRAGFQYIKTIIPFVFTISDISIDFGTLVPNVFSSLTTTLTVTSGAGSGYSVVASADHPLRQTTSSITIPDTTCDSGTCSETVAGIWTNTTRYGLGYNLAGDDIPAAFSDSTYFKQFGDVSLGEASQTVMSNAGVTASSIATVTYKVNVSNNQAAGDYSNAITYVATASY
jgi:hypothetical protein